MCQKKTQADKINVVLILISQVATKYQLNATKNWVIFKIKIGGEKNKISEEKEKKDSPGLDSD